MAGSDWSEGVLNQASSYHAHIYFKPGEEGVIEPMHARAQRDLDGRATVWPIRYRPVGPHPLPMFEIEFPDAHREAVLDWVKAHHGAQSVLLHPETGHVLVDHRDNARWLGERLELDLSFL